MRRKTCRRWIERGCALAALVLSAAARAQDWQPPLDDALKQAAVRHAPLLVEFHAPWCYSCYYMERDVLNGPEWEKVKRTAVVVDLDADSPEGTYWQKKLAVQGMPGYVVLDEKGAELGRIQVEQTRQDFYRQLDAIFAHAVSLDALRATVTDGGTASLAAAREVLKAYHARGDAEGGQAWIAGLPEAARTIIGADPEAHLWTARLQLLGAAQAKDPAQCAALAPVVLEGELGCERAYELERAMSCTAGLPAADQARLFAREKPLMTRLLYARVFVTAPTCADARSAVLVTADLDKTLGYTQAESDILERAIADTGQRLDEGFTKLQDLKPRDLRKNRNQADNLRKYLERAGRQDELEALYPKLIAAYPEDYVYPYRLGKSLFERGQYAEALVYLQQAAPKAYGINRLNVSALLVQTLLKLGRADDARQAASDALKANGPWFPEEAARLRALLPQA
jgi:tetratricopeptide (TPR) repeat protein